MSVNDQTARKKGDPGHGAYHLSRSVAYEWGLGSHLWWMCSVTVSTKKKQSAVAGLSVAANEGAILWPERAKGNPDTDAVRCAQGIWR
jgi:hypothetical protein